MLAVDPMGWPEAVSDAVVWISIAAVVIAMMYFGDRDQE